MTLEPREERPPRSPTLATFLSFLWPGLGQFYLGARRAALIFGIPLLIVLVVVVLQALGGAEDLLLELLTPSTALTVLILIVLFGVWRLVSMAEALGAAGPRGAWKRPVPLASFIVLAGIVIATHAGAASLAWSFYDAGKGIFVGVADPDVVPTASPDVPSAVPASGSPLPSASSSPSSPAPVASSRINILLTGIDSSQIRNHALNDTLIVVSVDPDTGDMAMISFPRDLARLPMPGGGTFAPKINSLMTYADQRPSQYPDGGMAALTTEISYLLGAKVDYYASVDLDGFSRLIDKVGGVTVDVTSAINDPGYGGWTEPGRIGFRISTGRHTLDGETALAFVRSRKGAGDNDFTRSRRQQQLLVALEQKLTDPGMLPNLPGILKAATQTLKTNFPPDQLQQMLAIARKTDEGSIKRYVLGPPYAENPANASSYMLVPDMSRFAKLSINLFGAASRYSTDAG